MISLLKKVSIVIIVSGIVVILLTAAHRAGLARHAAPLEEITIVTEELPHLDPHSHGAEDSVGDAHHGVNVEAPTYIVEEDMWVNSIQLEMHGAPKVTLHHLNLFANREIGSSSPSGLPVVDRWEIASFGQDTEDSFEYRRPYAVFLPKGTALRLSAMLHNPLPPKGPGEVYEKVSVGVRLSGPTYYVGTPREVRLERLVLADARSTSKETFVVPAHTMHYVKHSDAARAALESHTFTAPATIIRMGAHLHAWEGGESVEAYLNGKPLMTFHSRKNGPNPWDWYTEASPLSFRVNAGDTITLSSTYSNTEEVPLAGAMGMLSFRYSPDPEPSTQSLLPALSNFSSFLLSPFHQ